MLEHRLFWPLVALVVGLVLAFVPPMKRHSGLNKLGWVGIGAGALVALLVAARVG